MSRPKAIFVRLASLLLAALGGCPAAAGGKAVFNEIRIYPAIEFVYPANGTEVCEGDTVVFRWESRADVEEVQIYYYGGRCHLGPRSRGSFSGYVARRTFNTGRCQWQVPWMDAVSFVVRIAGFDAHGDRLGADQVYVRLRPKLMKDIKGDAIVVDKRHQRLYYQKNGKIVRMHLVSTAARGFTTPSMRPGSVDQRRGRTGQVFWKSRNVRSRMYDVDMRYWLAITASGSHGIHATSPNLYYRLGRPASHGCVRQHRYDAKILWKMVRVGTPVYVF